MWWSAVIKEWRANICMNTRNEAWDWVKSHTFIDFIKILHYWWWFCSFLITTTSIAYLLTIVIIICYYFDEWNDIWSEREDTKLIISYKVYSFESERESTDLLTIRSHSQIPTFIIHWLIQFPIIPISNIVLKMIIIMMVIIIIKVMKMMKGWRSVIEEL